MVVGDISTGTEVLVIGAGPGGYVAAIRAGQLGLDVTLVEKDAYGGTCLNYGCIPSKAMITASDLAYDADNAEDMGIYTKLDVNYGEMVDWKDDVVSQLTGGVEKLCKANGVTLMEGRAEFANDSSVRVVHDGEGQGSETVEFEHAVISTGSRPIQIPGFEFDGEHVLDSRAALSMDDVPESIVIVGAGYIGMELAGVFAKLGSDVTVVEMLDSVLPTYENDLARPVKKKADELGIDFHFGQAAKEWEESGNGITVMTENEDGDVSEFGAEKVLVAVGRQPVTDTLNLEVRVSRRTRWDSSRRTTAHEPRRTTSTPSATSRANRCWPTRRARKDRSPPKSSPANPRRSIIKPCPPPSSPTPKSARSA